MIERSTEKDLYGVTVEGHYVRSLLPEKINDIGRCDVTINPGSIVEGGVFCRDMTVRDGPVDVRGPVLCLGSFEMQGQNPSGTIRGPLAVAKSLLVRTPFAGQCSLRVIGDLSCARVAVDGAFVYGNVIGNSVHLKNSVVLGFVYAQSSLVLENCVAFTFLGNEVRIDGNVFIFNGAAAGIESLSLNGQLHVNAFQRIAQPGDGLVPIGTADIEQLSGTRPDGSQATFQMASCFDRVVDVKAAQDRMRENVNLIDGIVRQAAKRETTPESLAELELPLWQVLGGAGM